MPVERLDSLHGARLIAGSSRSYARSQRQTQTGEEQSSKDRVEALGGASINSG